MDTNQNNRQTESPSPGRAVTQAGRSRRSASPAATLLAVLALALFAGLPAHALEANQHRQTLERIDRAINIMDTDVSAEYTIEKRDPRGSSSTTVAAVFRRDRTEQFLVLILEPTVDKGRGYLKSGENIWLYDPADRTFTFTSARDRFQNSSIRTSDFERSNFAGNYRVVGSGTEQLGRFETRVLELEATTDRAAFPRVTLWVSEDDLVRKREDYSLSGQLLRTTAIPSYQRVRDRMVPAQMVIVDHLVHRTVEGRRVYERTTVTVRNPSLAPVSDAIYTRDYLERVTR